MSDHTPEIPQTLSRVVRELELHAAQSGWDLPARLFALVPTDDLLAREPALAEQLVGADALTPIEQDLAEPGQPVPELEQLLPGIAWPDEVAGAAAIIERLMLPPEADGQVPSDPAEAASYAAAHPGRQEVRIVAAVTRTGETWCALRMREHDNEESVLVGPDLVPGLIQLLQDSFAPDSE